VVEHSLGNGVLDTYNTLFLLFFLPSQAGPSPESPTFKTPYALKTSIKKTQRTGMRDKIIEPETMKAALAWLKSADINKRDAKLLKAKMAVTSDIPLIQALQSTSRK
jgi:hypothetical protein